MNDEELIYLWKTELLFSAKTELLEKYYEKIVSYLFNIMKKKFFNLPILFEDIKSYSFIFISEAIEEYRIHDTCSFQISLFVKTKQKFMRLCADLFNNGQKILNGYVHIDTLWKDNNPEMYKEDNWEILKVRELVNEYCLTARPITKKIIELWLEDYRPNEIATALSVSNKKVSNTIAILKKYLIKINKTHKIFI